MKLNIKDFRYLSPEDWRVLTAFEMGSKNHEVVPTSLAIQLSALKNSANGVNKSISNLAKADLIARVKNVKYDGYRLTYGGYDYLGLHALSRGHHVLQLGSTMGVGKESDIMLVTCPAVDGTHSQVQSVLKIHRLGRISFRSVSTNRDYLGKRSHTSWQYLSRLSAQKEYKAMNVLFDTGFRVPRPIAHNRHAIVMSLVPGLPLRAVPLNAFGLSRKEQERHVSALYGELIEIVLKLAERGIIHGDMNEFNIMLEGVVSEQSDRVAVGLNGDEEVTELEMSQHDEDDVVNESPIEEISDTRPEIIPHIIDFPQITSMSHPQAQEYFDRDVNGIKAFFRKRYHFQPEDVGPSFEEAKVRLQSSLQRGVHRLDIQIAAAGFDKKHNDQLDGHLAGTVDDMDDMETDLTVDDVPFQANTEISGIASRSPNLPLENRTQSKKNSGWSI